MSLLARFIGLIAFSTLMPAVVLGLYLVEQHDRKVDEAKHGLGALAKYAAENLDDKARGTVQLLHGLSRAPDLDTPDKAACSMFLADVLARYPHYTGLLTLTPSGDLHCDSLRSGRSLNFSTRDYFKEAVETLEPAFDVVMGGLTGIAVLQVAYPMSDAQGRLRFVLLASLNLSQYAEQVSGASPYPGMRMLVWSRKGVLVARKPDVAGASFIGRPLQASPLFRFAASAASGTEAELPDLDGTPIVWARASLPEARGGAAHFTLGVPREVLAAEANTGLRDALALLIFVSILAFAGAWYIAEVGIRRHLRRIVRAVARVGAGELGARIGTPYPHGELGELMTAVDRTAGVVQAQHADMAARGIELRQSNRTLRLLSSINTLIVRVRDRDELFSAACRIAVDNGGFLMAWIGIVDPGSARIVRVASAGGNTNIEAAIGGRLSDAGTGLPDGDLTAMAMGRRLVAVYRDVPNNPEVPLRAQLAGVGIRSMALLPLVVADEAVGILALYSNETDFFHEEELKLLAELSGDIAFAIDHIGKQERLDHLAYYDSLTDLANRSLFVEQVAQGMRSAAAAGHKLGLYVLDLERFRNINDTFGRAAGDSLLRQVAAWLTHEAGSASLLARLGADQFAVMLPRVRNEKDLARTLEKMIAAFMDHEFQVQDSGFRIAARAGVALFPEDGTDAEALVRHAETALKKAKAGGDRYVFYTEKMTETVAARLTLENQLRQALDREEFVLHYQPRVNLESGKVTAGAATLRWNDPRTGLVPPDKLIPILHETGLINEVGRWALRQAIEDGMRWRAAGLPAVRIAVKVSSPQLRHRGLVAEIERALARDAKVADGLELEMAESLIMEDVQHSIASLQAIRDLGVTVAIAGFGIGQSSLASLPRLPAHVLKIDRSFVLGMATGAYGMVLVSTLIKLAHSLKLNVVAEGVETEEQKRLLRLLACDEAQGFLFSEAVTQDTFAARFLAPARPHAEPALPA